MAYIPFKFQKNCFAFKEIHVCLNVIYVASVHLELSDFFGWFTTKKKI
jgi:hypothetical protein